MDQDTAGRFDISDPLGARLILLGRMCEEGNGYAAWLAYRLCRAEERAQPTWLTAYLDRAAAFVLDEYHRGDPKERKIEFALGLNAIKKQRDDGLRPKSPLELMRIAAPWGPRRGTKSCPPRAPTREMRGVPCSTPARSYFVLVAYPSGTVLMRDGRHDTGSGLR